MAQYGRILFYDTRDGEILLDTGEMEGNVPPLNPEDYYKILEAKYGNRNNIEYLQLEFGQYKEEFETHSYYRVVFPSKKLFFSQRSKINDIGAKSTRNDRKWPFFENIYNLYDESNNTFNEKLIHKFYNDYINFNLKSACKVAQPEWLSLNTIGRFTDRQDQYIPLWNNDIFPGIEEFALELLNDGFTFPLHVKKDDQIYKIYDGQHRFMACKYLESIGMWPNDKKILSLVMESIKTRFIDVKEVNYDLGKNIVMHMPTKTMPKYGFLKYESIKEYDEDITEVEVRGYLDVMVIARMYVTEMTRIISKYKQMTNVTLTDPLFNSENAFKDWLQK